MRAIEALDLDATGAVEWWEDSATTLHRVLMHVIAESQRHVGHADIVRELVDGSAGLQPGNDFLPSDDPSWWEDYRKQVQSAAEQATAG